MSDEAQSLRLGIRNGLLTCQCPRPYMTDSEDYHRRECEWHNAVKRIYELERAEDARNGK